MAITKLIKTRHHQPNATIRYFIDESKSNFSKSKSNITFLTLKQDNAAFLPSH